MRLGLPRHLRTHPRRQEPADRAVASSAPPSQGVFLVKGVGPLHLALSGDDVRGAWRSAALQGLNPLSSQARELKRLLPRRTRRTTELDSAGRVMLTPQLLEHAGIDREVVVTGAGDCLELWDRASLGGLRLRPRRASV